MWATPGGFKRPDETLDAAARRELSEETGVDVPSLLTQFGAYGDPGRDPRMNVVTVAYLAVLRDVGEIVAGTDASHAALVPASEILEQRIELAFDHLGIVRDAVERVRVELEVSGIATAFVGTTFTMAELRAVYEAIWGVQLDAANFRRSLVGEGARGEGGWVIPTGLTARPGRAAAGPRSSTGPGARGSTARRSIAVSESTRGSERMRAVVHDRYGPPEVLRVDEVEQPVPADDEVLVRVHASTVTRGDALGVRSEEYRFTRVFTGIRRPRRTGIGTEFAGVVEEVGAAVTELHVGDEVFGVASGANAEYVTVRESGAIAPKPRRADVRRGGGGSRRLAPRADLPAAGVAAPTEERPRLRRRGLRWHGCGSVARPSLRGGRDGGVRHEGRRARTVARRARRPRPFRRGLHDERRDLRRDLRRGRQALVSPLSPLPEARRDLHLDGSRVPVPRASPRLSSPASSGAGAATLGIGRYRKEDLLLVKELVEAGKYRPVIDRTYALDEVVEATRYVETGQKTGNVVLRIAEGLALRG